MPHCDHIHINSIQLDKQNTISPLETHSVFLKGHHCPDNQHQKLVLPNFEFYIHAIIHSFPMYCFLQNIVHKIHSCYCEFPLIVYFHCCLIFHAMHILHFIHSFCFDGHQSCFQLLPITSNIGMDILMPNCLDIAGHFSWSHAQGQNYWLQCIHLFNFGKYRQTFFLKGKNLNSHEQHQSIQ